MYNNIRFEVISKKSRFKEESFIISVILLIGAGSLFLWGLYFYRQNLTFTIYFAPIGVLLIGIGSLIRYIIQFQFKIKNKNSSKSVDQYSKKKELNNFRVSYYKCSGCHKNLETVIFKAPKNNLITSFNFTSLGIRGHFCYPCVKSYFYLEAIYLFLMGFIIEFVFACYFLLYELTFISLIIFLFLIIFIPIACSIVILIRRMKILRKYK
jgi:hypothetical protein